MPLSEREQRILEEIEKTLYEEDPSFAREVRRKAPRMAERRTVKVGALTFVIGFALLIAFFISSRVVVGVAAFGSMVAGIVLVAGSLRASLSPRRPPGPRVGDRVTGTLRSWEDKLRQRYRRS